MHSGDLAKRRSASPLSRRAPPATEVTWPGGGLCRFRLPHIPRDRWHAGQSVPAAAGFHGNCHAAQRRPLAGRHRRCDRCHHRSDARRPGCPPHVHEVPADIAADAQDTQGRRTAGRDRDHCPWSGLRLGRGARGRRGDHPQRVGLRWHRQGATHASQSAVGRSPDDPDSARPGRLRHLRAVRGPLAQGLKPARR